MDRGFNTTEVNIIQKKGQPIKVCLNVTNDGVLGADLHKKVSDHLGVEEAARSLFSLFISDGKKKRKLRLNESLPLSLLESDLTFEKWCFDRKVEKKVLSSPGCTNAQHQLFLHAQCLVEEGKLVPTTEQMQNLEGCLDPNFCTEKQYVEICHSIKNYFSFKAEGCQLLADIAVPGGKLSCGREAVVTLSNTGLSLCSGAHIEVSWYNVKWWSLCQRRLCATFSLNLCRKTPVTVTLETPQAELVISAVMEFIKILQVYNPGLPPFLASMVKSPPDGSTVWENSIFGAL